MRRSVVVRLLLLVVCCFLLLPAGQALAEDDFLPPPPPRLVAWTNRPLYDRYPVWHYTYDGTQGSFEELAQVYYLINQLQVSKAWLVKLTIRSVEYALYFDALTPAVQKAGSSLSALQELLWDATDGWLVRGGLALAGAAALYYWVLRGSRERAWRVLGGATVLLVGSYVVLVEAPSFLVNSATAARSLGDALLQGVALKAAPPALTEGKPGERLLRGAGEGVWRALVLDPWIEGEFMAGSAAKTAYAEGGVEGGKWLSYSPVTRMDKYRVNSAAQYQDFYQWDSSRAADYMPRRFMLSASSFALALVWAVSLLLVTGGLLYYQLLLFGILALLPLWLMLALWHPAGMRIARGVFLKGMGALVSQVVLMAVLAVALGLSGPLLQVGDPLGWLARGLLVSLFAAILCRYRFAWMRWGRAPRVTEGTVERAVPWTERILHHRTRAVSTREVVREAGALTPGEVLPQFREDLRAARRDEKADQVAASAQSATVELATVELADELRRLRLRFQGPGAPEAPRGEAAGRQTAGARGQAASAQVQTAPAPAVRTPPDVGQALGRYRRR